MQWSEYAARLIGGRNQSDIADLTGISQGTISRWLSGSVRPDAEKAVVFARGCGGNPVEALVILEVIRPTELEQVIQIGASADDLTNGQLVDLLAKRLGVRVTPNRRRDAG